MRLTRPRMHHRPPDLDRRRFLAAIPAVGASAALLGGCAAQEGAVTDVDQVLSISLGQAESHPSFASLVSFGERIAEATDGRYGARVYANNSLGDQQETVQLVSDGAIDMAVISGTQIENSSPRFLPMNVPGVFDDIDHQNRVMLDEDIVGDLFASLEPDMRLTVLGGYTQGSRHLYTAKGPIESPDDLAGLKVRVQESEIFLRLIRNIGAVPTPMAYSEVYTALQAGVLDGAENNEISYVTQRHYEVAEHFTLTNHLIGFDFMLMSTDRLEGMSEQDAEALRGAWAETQSEFVEIWKRETAAATEEMLERGVTITDPDPEVFAPIIEETGLSILEDDADLALYDAIRAAAEVSE